MKQIIKRYLLFCNVLLICMIYVSCSGDIEYKDLNKGKGSVSDVIIETTENVMPVNDSSHKEEISNEFLQKFYDFTEQTSVDIFQQNIDENQIYAPLNLYLSLSMLNELSVGEAREEIEEALGISDAKDNALELDTAIYALEKRRLALGRLNINNSLWLSDELSYQDDLLDMLQNQYKTEIYKGDLKSSIFQDKMTKWVYENTNSEFQPDYHKSLDVTDPHAFISLNTLDFYNEWLNPFDEEDTRAESFFLSGNEEISCDFMKMEDLFHPFMIGEDYKTTICILKENESMLFILPEEGLLVEDFIEKRGKLSDIIYDWTNNKFSMGKVKLSVPKFAYENEIDLKVTTESMGIKRIFDINSKAFSGFADENIYITDIWQASKIEIDEKGCSTSSYTEIRAQGSGVSKNEVEIYLNRPFIYILYKDKVPFLIGVVRNPIG
ncbi:MAG: serpin family protein [Clostridiales bacterium]|nr:serpin family protein [Clostridiales bacterium]